MFKRFVSLGNRSMGRKRDGKLNFHKIERQKAEEEFLMPRVEGDAFSHVKEHRTDNYRNCFTFPRGLFRFMLCDEEDVKLSKVFGMTRCNV